MTLPFGTGAAPLCLPVRNGVVTFHLNVDSGGLFLVDGGFIDGIARLLNALAGIGRSVSEIKALVLTHGHLDHTLNVEKLRQLSGCIVHAPAADRDHIAGTHQYRGASRVCGLSEALGRRLLRYRAPQVDHWFQPGETLSEVWGGLEVVGLPGHTAGHCGFESEKNRTLLVGDLFSHYGKSPRLPPPILNTQQSDVRSSVRRAADIAKKRGITDVFLNHGGSTDPEANLRALRQLAASD